jgi:hypothetical protein
MSGRMLVAAAFALAVSFLLRFVGLEHAAREAWPIGSGTLAVCGGLTYVAAARTARRAKSRRTSARLRAGRSLI